MKKIHLSKDVTFDLDAMMQTWGLLGNKGGGKTMTMQMLYELVHRAGAQGIAITPVSNWWSLLFDADGVGPGLKAVYVFGGKRAHYPLRPQDGKLIAQLLIRTRISAVIDVSMLRKGERRRFLTEFFEEFYLLKKLEDEPAPSVIFLEEAHAFAPQKPQPDEAAMLGAVEDICREGRNYGIGFVLGDQRPATVNKNVLALVEVLVALRTTYHLDRKVIDDWIEQHGIESDLDIEALLPHFKAGEAIVYAPMYGVLEHTQLNKKTTLDASATQRIGVKATKIGELSPVDDADLKAAMEQLEAEVAANDPKALKARIRDLETQLKKQPAPAATAPAKADPHTAALLKQLQKSLEIAMKFIVTINAEGFFKAAGKDASKAEIEHAIRAAVGNATKMLEAQAEQRTQEIGKLKKEASRVLAALEKANGDVVIDVSVKHNEPFTVAPTKTPAARAPAPPRAPAGTPPADLPEGWHKVLTATAQYPEGVTAEQLAVLTGYARSSRNTYIQKLSQAGLVEKRGNTISATAAGIAALGSDYQPLPTGDALLEHWLKKLPEGEARVLKLITDAHPATVEAESIDTALDYARSSRNTYLQKLGARKLVEKVGRGTYRASGELFG